MIGVLRGGLYLLLLTPLLYLPAGLFPFITLKIVIFQSLVEILAAIYLTLIILQPQWRPRLTPLTIAFSLFILSLVITASLGADWNNSLWSIPERGLGIFALIHFWLFFLILSGLNGQINWRRYLGFAFLVSVAVALVAFFQIGGELRPGSSLGNANFLASYLIFNIFIGLFLARKNKWWLAGVILEMAAVLITGSRAAVLALLIIFLGLGLYQLLQGKHLAAALIPFPEIIANLTRTDFLPRLNAWRITWQGIKERPLLGWGWENFDKVFNKYFEPRLLRQGVSETFFSKPHNMFLEYLLAGGLLTFLLFCGWLIAYFYQVRQQPILIGLGGAYLINNFFGFDSFGSYLMLMVVLALANHGHSMSPILTPPPPKADRRRTSNVAILNKIVFLIFLIIALTMIYFVNLPLALADYQTAQGDWQSALSRWSPYRHQLWKLYIVVLQELQPAPSIIEQGIAGLQQAIAENPEDYFLRAVLVEAAVSFGRTEPRYWDLAQEQISQLFQISPRRQQNLYLLAKLQLARGENEAMKKTMEQAIALDPAVGDSHFFYALFLFRSSEKEKALVELKLAEELGRFPETEQEKQLLNRYLGPLTKKGGEG